ncbi:hypothetical protein OG21DRAFT_1514733 [Imleria badia]|nr:hypothetical protein OG21DRAFT_1514733 [Imleria badia]
MGDHPPTSRPQNSLVANVASAHRMGHESMELWGHILVVTQCYTTPSAAKRFRCIMYGSDQDSLSLPCLREIFGPEAGAGRVARWRSERRPTLLRHSSDTSSEPRSERAASRTGYSLRSTSLSPHCILSHQYDHLQTAWSRPSSVCDRPNPVSISRASACHEPVDS